MWDVVLPQTLFGIVKYGTFKMAAYVQMAICNFWFRKERASKGKKNKYKEGQISKEAETVLWVSVPRSWGWGPDRRVKRIADKLCERLARKNLECSCDVTLRNVGVFVEE
jgi:hypothetical protein